MDLIDFKKLKGLIKSLVSDATTVESEEAQLVAADSIFSGIKRREVTFGADELNGFAAQGLDILPAVEGKYYSVSKVETTYKFGSTAYVDANNGNYFLTGASIQDYEVTILTSAQSRTIHNVPFDNQERNLTQVANEPIRLTGDDQAPGYPSGGDGTLTIVIYYTLEDA